MPLILLVLMQSALRDSNKEPLFQLPKLRELRSAVETRLLGHPSRSSEMLRLVFYGQVRVGNMTGTLVCRFSKGRLLQYTWSQTDSATVARIMSHEPLLAHERRAVSWAVLLAGNTLLEDSTEFASVRGLLSDHYGSAKPYFNGSQFLWDLRSALQRRTMLLSRVNGRITIQANSWN